MISFSNYKILKINTKEKVEKKHKKISSKGLQVQKKVVPLHSQLRNIFKDSMVRSSRG